MLVARLNYTKLSFKFASMILDGEKNYIPKKLGQRIRDIRTSKNISTELIATECGVSEDFLSDIENGKVDVTYITLYQLAECFEMSIGDLIDNV